MEEKKKSLVSDLVQGVRNCPPSIIPGKCAWCPVLNRRTKEFRKENSRKPRCAEPNFNLPGVVGIKNVDDVPFHHENMYNIFITPPYRHEPEYFCVCGKSRFLISFSQQDKFHFPQMLLKCICGRSKKIVILDGYSMLAKPGEPDLPLKCVLCQSCLKKVYYLERGTSFFPAEGPTICLVCSKCKSATKHSIKGVDDGEPWLYEKGPEREKITVYTSVSQRPDFPEKETGHFLEINFF